MEKQQDRNILFIMECVMIILICYLHVLSTSHYLEFSLINGTFQNYNPIRRYLARQIPYRDFQDYLGLGHLYS